MQYHVGDKVRIKDTCRIDSLRAGDIVTIDWVGIDLNNIVLYTVREDPKGNLLDECEIEPYNVGWVCPRCGAVNAPWVRTCCCRRVDVDLGHGTFCDHDWEYICSSARWVCRKCGAQQGYSV